MPLVSGVRRPYGVGMLWCRECGLELSYSQLHLGLYDHRHFDPEAFRWNSLMVCASCVVGRPISPDSSRQHERVLYYLITYGIARIEFYQSYKPDWLPYIAIHESTGGHANAARGIAGKAVQKIPRTWVASHKQDEGYFLSHLKTSAEPCMPLRCPIDRAEERIKREAREREKQSKVISPEKAGLFPNPHHIPQVH